MSTFLGIYREPDCSPGQHRENDATILELAAAGLERRGHRVALAPADQAARFARAASAIFSMSRSPETLAQLTRWAGGGTAVVNAPGAVLATARRRLAERALAGIALPRAQVVPTARALRRERPAIIDGEWWVKGGDLYASRREDVQRVTSMDALDRSLDDFERRGITSAVLQEHVRGREIKFYAVEGTEFFFWLDAAGDRGTTGQPFQAPALASGAALALEIFGGDLVVGDDGRITLIDLNDWPSFAPCREAAATAIAGYLERRAERCAPASTAEAPAPSASG